MFFSIWDTCNLHMVLAALNLSAFNAGIVLTRYDLSHPYRLNLNDDHGVLPHVLLGCGGWRILVSAPVPLGLNGLTETGLGQGFWGLCTKGLGLVWD